MIDLMRIRLASLQPSYLEIIDDSAKHAGHAGNNGGGHYTIVIESSLFSGKSMIICHQLVYQAIGDFIPSRIHALSIKINFPNESKTSQSAKEI